MYVLLLIVYRTCLIFMPFKASYVSALLFAIHPIHTEAVTGIVGRAESLCSIFFLTSFLLYKKATQKSYCTSKYFAHIYVIKHLD